MKPHETPVSRLQHPNPNQFPSSSVTKKTAQTNLFTSIDTLQIPRSRNVHIRAQFLPIPQITHVPEIGIKVPCHIGATAWHLEVRGEV